MEKRDRQFSANEMKHLAPFGFYLHNLCLVMEDCEIMGVDNEGKAVEVRESILAYLKALLTLVCTRHDFLVANAVMSKTNPGLIAYLRISQGAGFTHVCFPGAVRQPPSSLGEVGWMGSR
jgi:hypothetical protein